MQTLPSIDIITVIKPWQNPGTYGAAGEVAEMIKLLPFHFSTQHLDKMK
jgi:hypothetical protein